MPMNAALLATVRWAGLLGGLAADRINQRTIIIARSKNCERSSTSKEGLHENAYCRCVCRNLGRL